MGRVRLLVVALVLLALPGLSLAAVCSGNNPGQCGSNLATREEMYAARQTYCANNLWTRSSCFLQGKVKITFSNPGANNQQVCWDALENIINQCGSNYLRGTYNYNGDYGLSRCNAIDGLC